MIDMRSPDRSPDPDKPALGPALCSLLRFERWVFLFQKRKAPPPLIKQEVQVQGNGAPHVQAQAQG